MLSSATVFCCCWISSFVLALPWLHTPSTLSVPVPRLPKVPLSLWDHLDPSSLWLCRRLPGHWLGLKPFYPSGSTRLPLPSNSTIVLTSTSFAQVSIAPVSTSVLQTRGSVFALQANGVTYTSGSAWVSTTPGSSLHRFCRGTSS